MRDRRSGNINTVIYPIQYMRAGAALAVFFYHISATISGLYGESSVTIDQIGAAGVDLFFVISGFIMAKIVWERPVNPKDFMWRRAVRVVPLYWLATLAVFAVALFAPSLMGSTKADYLQLLHSLLFLPYGVNPDSNAPTLLVGWTLNYEMFFYVLVALFAGLLSDKRLLKLSLFLLVLAVIGWIGGFENGYLRFYLDPMILEFVMGIVVFHCWRLTQNIASSPVFIIGMVLSLIAMIVQFESDPGEFRIFMWGLPAAVFLLCGIHAIKFKSNVLCRLGDWSYAIYVLHLFVIMGFLRVLLPALPSPSMPWQAAYVIMTGGLLLVSALAYHLFEQPVRRYFSRQK